MNCSKCDKKLRDDDEFCPKCGEKITHNSSEKKETVIKWNPTVLLILPIIWFIFQKPYVEELRPELVMEGRTDLIYAETVSGSFMILIIPLFITFVIFMIQKIKKKPYANIVKHTFIGGILLFILFVAATLNGQKDRNEYLENSSSNIEKEKCYITHESLSEAIAPGSGHVQLNATTNCNSGEGRIELYSNGKFVSAETFYIHSGTIEAYFITTEKGDMYNKISKLTYLSADYKFN